VKTFLIIAIFISTAFADTPPPMRLAISNFPAVQVTSSIDGQRQTFSAVILNLTAAISPTDIFTISGSASKVIRILRLGFTANQSTSGAINVVILKRSTANTGGVSTAQVSVPHDSVNNTATATVLAYTTNPTALGTLIGNIRAYKYYVLTTNPNAGGSVSTPGEWTFGDGNDQSIVLRGTSQILSVNLAANTIFGSSINVFVEWSEE
jgi:hypothetical protein